MRVVFVEVCCTYNV